MLALCVSWQCLDVSSRANPAPHAMLRPGGSPQAPRGAPRRRPRAPSSQESLPRARATGGRAHVRRQRRSGARPAGWSTSSRHRRKSPGAGRCSSSASWPPWGSISTCWGRPATYSGRGAPTPLAGELTWRRRRSSPAPSSSSRGGQDAAWEGFSPPWCSCWWCPPAWRTWPRAHPGRRPLGACSVAPGVSSARP